MATAGVCKWCGRNISWTKDEFDKWMACDVGTSSRHTCNAYKQANGRARTTVANRPDPWANSSHWSDAGVREVVAPQPSVNGQLVESIDRLVVAIEKLTALLEERPVEVDGGRSNPKR